MSEYNGRLFSAVLLFFFGYMTYLKVVSGIPADWAGLANLFETAFVGVSYLYVYRHMLKEDYVI